MPMAANIIMLSECEQLRGGRVEINDGKYRKFETLLVVISGGAKKKIYGRV